MAYETGTTTGPNDLLDKFRIFAAAQGWAVNRNVAAGSGREVCISKGTAYFNFRSIQNETIILNGNSSAARWGVALNGSDSYSSGATWDRQPGYPLRISAINGDQGHVWMPLHDLSTGPYVAYHFFSHNSGQTLYCELEVVTGVFQRWGVGSLDLFNPSAPGGGRFFYSTGGAQPGTVNGQRWRENNPDQSTYTMEMVPFRWADQQGQAGDGYGAGQGASGAMVRVGFAPFDNWAGSGRNNTYTYMREACQGMGCHDKPLTSLSPAPLNGVAVLATNMVSFNIGNEFLSPIGTMRGFRHMDMSNYLPGDEFTLGSETWKVFPWYQKGGITGQRAIAILKE